MAIYALALSLAPAARNRTWDVAYPWSQWVAVGLWCGVFFLAHRHSKNWLPERDPYLLPVAALLSGWGLLTVWRLYQPLGIRQVVWLVIAVGLLTAGLRLPSELSFLRRYKYLWLSGGLLLTGLTLFLGTNPLGYGPHMWLGCCGIYLQPSEPLKLLLIVYLAAYLADRLTYYTPVAALPASQAASPLLPLLGPTLIMTGLALSLLLIQRDLGTAFIFIFLYTAIVYITSGRRRILLAGGAALLLSGAAGYLMFDVVRVRIDAWINPWLDPSGRSYQIVQSLLAVANGGLLGRGPGMGSPGLVPVPHSDFIFASITEETGLLGALGLLLLVALLAERGLRIALYAPDNYRRFLAAGLTAHLAAQSVLIIGGNLRLMPLTGVTLPFVSYGGSSLVTSFLSLLILMHISNQSEAKPAVLRDTRPYLQLQTLLLVGLAAAALAAGWWAILRGPVLLARTDNPRRVITDRLVRRGSILDRNNQPINDTTGERGSYTRQTLYPDLSVVLGYTNPSYGQSGLEASIDPILRGQQGNPGLTIWWYHLLYGQPPPGLDVRTSLDLDLQRIADERLGGHHGAVVLLNAKTGEILAMASHPAFDSNRLSENWEKLVDDPNAPLLNRATLGLYPTGAALGPLLLADILGRGGPPALPGQTSFSLDGYLLDCATTPTQAALEAEIASGCPGPVAVLGKMLGAQRLAEDFRSLGLYSSPNLRLPVANEPQPGAISDPASASLGQGLSVSPLQMALAAATLSNGGTRPPPYLVTAINTPESGWNILKPLEQSAQALMPSAANEAARSLAGEDKTTWQSTATVPNGSGKFVSWFLGGTLPDWEGTPLAVAVLVEEKDPRLAASIGQAVLQAAILP